ncbi:MAG: DUF2073 domain-containing protein [Nanoarchaeota archaeon]
MLTLQFVPYAEIEHLESDMRIGKLLNIVKDNKIVLMQGRLQPEEETLLIQHTMLNIDRKFSGIEICTIFPEERDLQFFNKMKKGMVKMLIGNRDGITIIGPASVVKEIKRDPKKMQLFTITPRFGSRVTATRRSSSRSSKRRRR